MLLNIPAVNDAIEKNNALELRGLFVYSGPETFPDLTYIVQMRRRPLFYVFNMILPCFLITTVAFLGFCVPSDSGKLSIDRMTIVMKLNV
jgi:hypothetical protein